MKGSDPAHNVAQPLYADNTLPMKEELVFSVEDLLTENDPAVDETSTINDSELVFSVEDLLTEACPALVDDNSDGEEDPVEHFVTEVLSTELAAMDENYTDEEVKCEEQTYSMVEDEECQNYL